MKGTESDQIDTRPVGLAPAEAELIEELRAEAEAVEHDLRSALRHAIRAGELLTDAKALVGHGKWLAWLEANFPGSRSTAANYMRLADPANVERVAHLPTVRAALEYLADGGPTREAWLRAAAERIAPLIRERCGLPLDVGKVQVSVAPAHVNVEGKNIFHAVEGSDIYVNAHVEEEQEVLGTLAHELLHAALPPETRHGKEFKKAAEALGMLGKPTECGPDEELAGTLRALVDDLGPYPHRPQRRPKKRGPDTVAPLKLFQVESRYMVMWQDGQVDPAWLAVRDGGAWFLRRSGRDVIVEPPFHNEAEIKAYIAVIGQEGKDEPGDDSEVEPPPDADDEREIDDDVQLRIHDQLANLQERVMYATLNSLGAVTEDDIRQMRDELYTELEALDDLLDEVWPGVKT